MIGLAILGATGSIGAQTAVVAKSCGIDIILLSGGENTSQMIRMCSMYNPKYVVMASEEASSIVSNALQDTSIKVYSGEDNLCLLLQNEDIDTVMAAITGIAGLKPTLAAICAGKTILLANKEALITSGKIFIETARRHNSVILPVDSEHNAIFQCLDEANQLSIGYCDLTRAHVRKIILTGSGGPFLHTKLGEFPTLTVESALKHPNWTMGAKITIDSATMMNKGFEYIEARWLFNIPAEKIEIVIHPESIIHSMVQYEDGSILAQMANPDMKVPISYALNFPQRKYTNPQHLDLIGSKLSFFAMDYTRYPCCKLAIDSYAAGQYATTALNAANEISVAAFLAHKISFTQLYELNKFVVEKTSPQELNTIDDVFSLDKTSRDLAKKYLTTYIYG